MTRISSIDDALFSVEVVPAGAIIQSGAVGRFVPSRTSKAIIDTARNRVVGIVGTGYRLVTNRQALDWATRCGEAAFPRTSATDWVPYSVDGPPSGGYCRIDLVHRAAAFDALGKAYGFHENYGPFIRVTNSYNRQRALNFDVGLVRSACSNGVVISETLISFSFPHSRSAISGAPAFNVNRPRLETWLDRFDESLSLLRTCGMSPSQIRQLTCNVLRLTGPRAKASRYMHDSWSQIEIHIDRLIDRYADEVGCNAYAAFNVMTDFATRPVGRGAYARERHTLQRRAGAWFNEFSQACDTPSFQLDAYLKSLDVANQ